MGLPGGDPRDLLVAPGPGAVGEPAGDVPRPARSPGGGLVEGRPAPAPVARAPELLQRRQPLPVPRLVGVPPQRPQPLARGHPQPVEHLAGHAVGQGAPQVGLHEQGCGPGAPERLVGAVVQAPGHEPGEGPPGDRGKGIHTARDAVEQLVHRDVRGGGLDPLLHERVRQQRRIRLAPSAVGQPGGDQPRGGGRVDQLGRLALALGQDRGGLRQLAALAALRRPRHAAERLVPARARRPRGSSGRPSGRPPAGTRPRPPPCRARGASPVPGAARRRARRWSARGA